VSTAEVPEAPAPLGSADSALVILDLRELELARTSLLSVIDVPQGGPLHPSSLRGGPPTQTESADAGVQGYPAEDVPGAVA
jgi:hypothetical protein